jgi:hypothetical protein
MAGQIFKASCQNILLGTIFQRKNIIILYATLMSLTVVNLETKSDGSVWASLSWISACLCFSKCPRMFCWNINIVLLKTLYSLSNGFYMGCLDMWNYQR